MMTGDNARTAAAIAGRAGIDTMLAEVLPADNQTEVTRLQAAGEVVAMVGDGVNDPPRWSPPTWASPSEPAPAPAPAPAPMWLSSRRT